MRVVVFVLAIFMFLLLMKVFLYNLFNGRNQRLKGLVYAYTLTIETYSTFFQLHTAAIETILWNNTVNIWGKPSLAFFEEMSDFTKSYIYPNIEESLKLDLGNLTEFYRNNIMLQKTCGHIIFQDDPQNCQLVYDRILNSNLLIVYKEMQYSLMSMIEVWKEARSDWLKVKEIINSNTMKSIWAYYLPISDGIYYFFVDSITTTLVGEIESNTKLVKQIGRYGELILLAWATTLGLFIMKGLDIYNAIRRRAIKVTPQRLWKSNYTLNKNFLR